MSPRLDSRWGGSSLSGAGVSPAGSAGLNLAHRRISPDPGPPRTDSLRRCIVVLVPPPDALSVRVETRSCVGKTSGPTCVAEPASPSVGRSGPARSGRLTQTALEHSEHLGWAEIRHPYHPLRGQRFPVLKKRRIAATDTLILRGLDCGTFSVAREWTDWADPSAGDSLKLPRGRLDAESLLALVTLLEQLPQPPTEKS